VRSELPVAVAEQVSAEVGCAAGSRPRLAVLPPFAVENGLLPESGPGATKEKHPADGPFAASSEQRSVVV
jgi:hypothetical protein